MMSHNGPIDELKPFPAKELLERDMSKMESLSGDWLDMIGQEEHINERKQLAAAGSSDSGRSHESFQRMVERTCVSQKDVASDDTTQTKTRTSLLERSKPKARSARDVSGLPGGRERTLSNRHRRVSRSSRIKVKEVVDDDVGLERRRSSKRISFAPSDKDPLSDSLRTSGDDDPTIDTAELSSTDDGSTTTASPASSVQDDQNSSTVASGPQHESHTSKSRSLPDAISMIKLEMIEEHSLLDIPRGWMDRSPHLREISNNGAAWKTYSKFRKSVQDGLGYQPRANSTSSRISEGDEDEQTAANISGGDSISFSSASFSHDRKVELLQQATDELRALSSELSFPYPKCIGAFLWPDNAHIRVNDLEIDENGDVVDLTVHAMVFSPLAVPRAVQLGHQYRRSEGGMVNATWKYRNIDFSERTHIKRGPWTTLASVELEGEYVVSTATNGLSRDALSKMRGWLFGTYDGKADAIDTTADGGRYFHARIIDDFAFLSLVFASTLTPLTPSSSHSLLSRRSIGRTWPRNQMTVEGDQVFLQHLQRKVGHTIKETSWLEVEVRKVTGSLRKQDEFFEL